LSYVLLGTVADGKVWLVDLKSGTVSELEQPAGGDIASVLNIRKSGCSVVKGVDLAIAIPSTADVAGGFLEVAGGFLEGA
jgi:hypothetical protein